MSRLVLIPKPVSKKDMSESLEKFWQRIYQSRELLEDYEIVSIADGEKRVLDVYTELYGGEIYRTIVCGLVASQVEAEYVISDTVAMMEASACVGIHLIDKKWNLLNATSFGVGEMLMHILLAHSEATQIVVSIGECAADDGGIGMAAALGYRFYDEKEMDLAPLASNMTKIRHIEKPGDMFDKKVLMLCKHSDVSYRSVLYKDVNQETVRLVDQGLENLADVILKDLGKDVKHVMYSYGGLAAGLAAFLSAVIVPTIELVYLYE